MRCDSVFFFLTGQDTQATGQFHLVLTTATSFCHHSEISLVQNSSEYFHVKPQICLIHCDQLIDQLGQIVAGHFTEVFNFIECALGVCFKSEKNIKKHII